MSKDWAKDINDMHAHYGHHEPISKLSNEHLRSLLKFRYDFLMEELTEMNDAIELKDGNTAEEVVDALIDLIVVAIGTLDAFSVDPYKAWDEVLKANMAKKTGIKPERPNPLGLPDLIKPEGWVAPSHADNHGVLDLIYPR